MPCNYWACATCPYWILKIDVVVRDSSRILLRQGCRTTVLRKEILTKHIFITGGVCSSLGKGIAAASIGALLEAYGLKVTLQKIDPYINVDPGTMSPYQHGEVYVTDDGAETDLDLGHYERFTNATLSKLNAVTTGQIYETIIKKERHGDYLGATVQVVPHITDEIKNRIISVGKITDSDIVITEIGGTIGDIESLPFLEAIRQLKFDIGSENILYVHLTLVPFLKVAGEVKTKPTQHSVRELREIGIQPGILLCRTEEKFSNEIRNKIAMFCNVSPEAVFQAVDVNEIYEIPLNLENQGMDREILRQLNIRKTNKNLDKWYKIKETIANSTDEVKIAVVGKYLELQDAYKSIYEALRHSGFENRVKINIIRVDAEGIEKESDSMLNSVDGILIPGGFGIRGIEGKICAVQYARENKIPFLGICLGMQCAVIEFARNVCGMKDASSLEFNPEALVPVISLMPSQKGIQNLGGTMRLGLWKCNIGDNTKALQVYRRREITERHRHRYEVNDQYIPILREHGLVFSGINPDNNLVEIIEISDHPFFIGCQFHPEFKSKPFQAHPLFREFIKHSLKRKKSSKLFLSEKK